VDQVVDQVQDVVLVDLETLLLQVQHKVKMVVMVRLQQAVVVAVVEPILLEVMHLAVVVEMVVMVLQLKLQQAP
tara:strand:+ start:146 stop:367 length:222 start_codon:yes stop_codon:yes gene_type:complete